MAPPAMEGDFDSWPPPPAGDRCALQWNHRNWDKWGEGTYVLTREVRESMHDCHGIWPLLDERHGVPRLLDRANFVKYCHYAYTVEEYQAFDPPEGYTPLDYDKDEASRREWTDRRLRERYNSRYWMPSKFDLLGSLFPDEEGGGRHGKKRAKKVTVDSKKNRYYIHAVKKCRPDAIRALFDKGTDDVCPDCLEVGRGEAPNVRRGVVAHAMDNLYDEDGGRREAQRAAALECLRLVCSLEGVDVDADTWHAPSDVGPPLVRAVNNLDVGVAKILLEAGARVAFPGVVILNDQWCNLRQPPDYPEHYQTALHVCVASGADAGDEERSAMLSILLEAGSDGDVCVKAPCNPEDPEERMTALEMLEEREAESDAKYPLSKAVLKKAEASAGKKGAGDVHQKPAGYERKDTTDVESKVWAKITDLDKEMQGAVSRYIDVFQWEVLKRSAKVLKSWPRPPPPQIDYHVIRFCITDNWGEAHAGIALTPVAVLDAFKFVAANSDSQQDIESLSLQFLCIRDVDEPIIPLVQFKQSECCQTGDFYNIHPCGAKHFGVEEAEKGLPEGSVLKSHTEMNYITIYHSSSQDEPDYFDGLTFDDCDIEGAFVWLEGVKPSKDIDLKHLWCTEGKDEESFDDEYMYEIWLNKSKVEGGRRFTYGNDGKWAVCKETTNLWDT